MRTFISIPLAGLFVFLAAFNSWIMLTGRGANQRSRNLWTLAHRIAGYTFITLFVVFSYFMLMRVKGSSDELSPRIMLHMALALSLAPLLLVKVIAVRSQKAPWGLLMTLGIGIFAIAFTLVFMNVAVHYLRELSPNKVPFAISLRVIAVVVILAAIALFGRNRQAKARASTIGDLSRSISQQPSAGGQVLNLTLARIEPQTTHAKTLRFLLPRGQQIAARPGQFLTFEWVIDGNSVTRSYSICSSPTHANFIEITPKRVENGCVSQFLNERATAGLTVKARGPYGQFCFDESKHNRAVMIAGGSGITPIMAMLRYIDELCIRSEATLIYCVRTEQDVLFKDELVALKRKLSNFRYVLVFSQPASDWTGWKGRLRRESLEREVKKPYESTFFLCGPPAFMELGRTLLKQMAVEPFRILQESFGGAVGGERSSAETSKSTAGFLQLEFYRSAVAYKVSPNETLLQSSEKNGVLIPSGCRQGVCGTCATKLLSGNVQMKGGEALTDELRSHNFILPCVSWPQSDITLDA